MDRGADVGFEKIFKATQRSDELQTVIPLPKDFCIVPIKNNLSKTVLTWNDIMLVIPVDF